MAEFIIDLGFVPHGELWEHVADVEKPEGEESKTNCRGLAIMDINDKFLNPGSSGFTPPSSEKCSDLPWSTIVYRVSAT